MNTYGYAKANPVNLTDPLGLLTFADVEYGLQKAGWWVGVQLTELKDSPSQYFETLRCVVAVKKEYDKAVQELQKYGPAKDAIEFLKFDIIHLSMTLPTAQTHSGSFI